MFERKGTPKKPIKNRYLIVKVILSFTITVMAMESFAQEVISLNKAIGLSLN